MDISMPFVLQTLGAKTVELEALRIQVDQLKQQVKELEERVTPPADPEDSTGTE